MSDLAYLDALRLALKAERRGDYTQALTALDAAFETAPLELEELIGAKIIEVQKKLVEQRKDQLGLFGKAKMIATGKVS